MTTTTDATRNDEATMPHRQAVAASSGFQPPAEADWHRAISEAAYFIAERRAFQNGDPAQDWLEAERDIRDRGPA